MTAVKPRVGGTLPPPPFYPDDFDGDKWKPGRWDWVIRLVFAIVHLGLGGVIFRLYWVWFLRDDFNRLLR